MTDRFEMRSEPIEVIEGVTQVSHNLISNEADGDHIRMLMDEWSNIMFHYGTVVWPEPRQDANTVDVNVAVEFFEKYEYDQLLLFAERESSGEIVDPCLPERTDK